MTLMGYKQKYQNNLEKKRKGSLDYNSIQEENTNNSNTAIQYFNY